MSPRVYIVAGPNGAGKTTFARVYLPQYADCRHFVNADLIAQGISPFSPEVAAFTAGRLMVAQIQSLIRRRGDFGFETTLAGRRHGDLFRRLIESDYEVHLFYLWLERVEIGLSRIQTRVLQGGHDVPAAVVRRRFTRSVSHFFLYTQGFANRWILFDNSGGAPILLASQKGGEIDIMDKEKYANLISRYTRR